MIADGNSKKKGRWEKLDQNGFLADLRQPKSLRESRRFSRINGFERRIFQKYKSMKVLLSEKLSYWRA